MLIALIFALALLILLRWLIVRMSPRLWRYLSAGPWGDALCYFLQTQYYRMHSGREIDQRCLFRGSTLHTPSWYQKLIGRLFSDQRLWSAPWLPNLVLYGVGAAIFVAFLGFVPQSSAPGFLTLAVTLFAAQADNSRFDKLSVHYVTIQPRFLGMLSLSLYGLFFVAIADPMISGILGTVVLLVALNTSVFSRQVCCTVIPLTGLISWNAVPVIELLLATVLSLAINREEFTQSVQAECRYSKWYLKNFYQTRQDRGIQYVIRSVFAPQLRDLPRYVDSFLALALLTFVLTNNPEDAFATRLFAVIASAIIVCSLTGVRRLAALGECWRYISFSCYFVTPIALAYCIIELGWSQLNALLLACAFLAYNVFWTITRTVEELNPIRAISLMLDKALPAQVNGNRPAPEKPIVWWSAHYRYGSIPVSLGRGAATFEIQGTDLSEKAMDEFFVKYPYLHCRTDFLDRFEVTHLLISKKEWPEQLYGPLDRIMTANTVLVDEDNFAILARTHPSIKATVDTTANAAVCSIR